MKEVDAIIIFNTETPESIIESLNPDILIKGGDYNKNDIVIKNVIECIIKYIKGNIYEPSCQ